MDKTAVLIPCFNESRTIEKVIKDFRKVLPEAAGISLANPDSTAGSCRHRLT